MSDLEQLVGFGSTSFDFGVCVISCGQRRGLSRDPPLSRTKISAVLLYLILLIMGLALSSERGIIVLGELCSTLEGYVTEQDHGFNMDLPSFDLIRVLSFGQSSNSLPTWSHSRKIKQKVRIKNLRCVCN